jgi:hypothetical protein
MLLKLKRGRGLEAGERAMKGALVEKLILQKE